MHVRRLCARSFLRVVLHVFAPAEPRLTQCDVEHLDCMSDVRGRHVVEHVVLVRMHTQRRYRRVRSRACSVCAARRARRRPASPPRSAGSPAAVDVAASPSPACRPPLVRCAAISRRHREQGALHAEVSTLGLTGAAVSSRRARDERATRSAARRAHGRARRAPGARVLCCPRGRLGVHVGNAACMRGPARPGLLSPTWTTRSVSVPIVIASHRGACPRPRCPAWQRWFRWLPIDVAASANACGLDVASRDTDG